MEKKVNILSTKELDPFYKRDILPLANLVDFDLLELEKVDCEEKAFQQNIIFTSYKATLRGLEVLGDRANDHHYYCVGKKSEKHLKNLGLEVYGFAYYSKDLAELLVENLSTSSFSYLCSKDRLNTLPDILKENNVTLEEIYTYRTSVVANLPTASFDIYLWFSPKGVREFGSEVPAGAQHLCIGETTAAAAKERFSAENVFCPSSPIMEELIKLTSKKAEEINLKKCNEAVTNNN